MLSISTPSLRIGFALALVLYAFVIPTMHAQTAVRIVALGASNTEGWGLSPEHAYPVRLQALLKAKGIDATVVNAGIAGDATGGMLGRLDSAVPAGTHMVILQPGTNDERMGSVPSVLRTSRRCAASSPPATPSSSSSRTACWTRCRAASCATTRAFHTHRLRHPGRALHPPRRARSAGQAVSASSGCAHPPVLAACRFRRAAARACSAPRPAPRRPSRRRYSPWAHDSRSRRRSASCRSSAGSPAPASPRSDCRR